MLALIPQRNCIGQRQAIFAADDPAQQCAAETLLRLALAALPGVQTFLNALQLLGLLRKLGYQWLAAVARSINQGLEKRSWHVAHGRQHLPQLLIGLDVGALRILGNQHFSTAQRLGAEQQRKLFRQVVIRAELEWLKHVACCVLQQRIRQPVVEAECVEQFIALVYGRFNRDGRVFHECRHRGSPPYCRIKKAMRKSEKNFRIVITKPYSLSPKPCAESAL